MDIIMNATFLRSTTALFLGLSAGLGAHAQDADDDEPEVAQQARPVFVLNEPQFAQWAFGAQDTSAVRSRLESFLTIKIEAIDRACGLTEAQKNKLRLAGKGDIKRLWDRVEEKKRKYLNVPHDQEKINEIVQDLQPLRTIASGEPFTEGTFFAKTLHSMLTGDQLARFESAARDKALFRYRAKVDLVIATLDQMAGFSEKQRQELRQLVLEETQPPQKFGQYDYQVAFIQIARLPEEKLKGLFDDTQWRVLKRRLDQARAMEQALINNGALPGPAPFKVELLPAPAARLVRPALPKAAADAK